MSPAVASVVTYACGKKKLTERSGGISTIVKLLLKGFSSLKNQLTVELFRNQSRFKRSAVSQGCSENDDPENEDPITQTTENCKQTPENADPKTKTPFFRFFFYFIFFRLQFADDLTLLYIF